MQVIMTRMAVTGMTVVRMAVLTGVMFVAAAFFEVTMFMFPVSMAVRVSVSVTTRHHILRRLKGIRTACSKIPTR